MDFSKISGVQPADTSAKMEVRDNAGATVCKADGTPITITLLGKDSDVWTKHTNATGNRRLNTRGGPKFTMESIRAENIAGFAKCTVEWDGVGIGEDSTPCTYENAVKLYTAFPLIYEQVDEFMGERANFLPTSPTN